jgi:acyl-CoA thioester hydrolase
MLLTEHEITLRVHYHEVDGQGRVHNSQYLNYFERGRVEMLRASSISYREIENAGIMLVVRRAELQFHSPALFDDALVLRTRLTYCHGARIEHQYQLFRPNDLDENGVSKETLLVSGVTEIGCIDSKGRARRLPAELQLNMRGNT